MKGKYVKGLIIIVVIIIGGIFIYQNINKENKPLPEVKLKEIVNKDKSFAIMIQNENGYKEYNSDTWPGNGYKFKEAKCIDNNGDEIKEAVTYEEGKITLTTNKTVYCTVYFDYKGTINILRENDTQKYLSEEVPEESPEELPGGMYRYQASFPECDNKSECLNATKMTNWICFGTTNNCGTNDDNIDKYMYRIIGVTKDGQLYLLKETVLKESEIKGFAWNSKYSISNCLGDACEWPNSDIYKRLNGTTSNGNPIFVNNSEYEYMAKTSDWYKLIEEHNWMYGDTNETKFNGNEMYAIETGKTTTKRIWPDEGQETCSDDSSCTEKDYIWTKNIPAKIGLMYIHDIDYAYIGGNLESYTNVKKGWIYFQKDGYNLSSTFEWLIPRFAFSTNVSHLATRCVMNDGRVTNGTVTATWDVRPTFYLLSSAKIASGSGTKSNPYILDVQE